MASESESAAPTDSGPPAHQRGADGADLVGAALDFFRGISSSGSESFGPPTRARQKEDLRQWADGLGLLLRFLVLPSKILRGDNLHISLGVSLCHSASGFMTFITEPLVAEHSLHANQTATAHC